MREGPVPVTGAPHSQRAKPDLRRDPRPGASVHSHHFNPTIVEPLRSARLRGLHLSHRAVERWLPMHQALLLRQSDGFILSLPLPC